MNEKAFYQERTVNGLGSILALSYSILEDRRKAEFDLRLADTPPELVDLGELLSGEIDHKLNTAIVKRYDNRDPFVSGAYSPHHDPKKYAGRIVLVSPDSLAYLFIFTPKGIQSVECREGTAVDMRADQEHQITPPLKGYLRHMIFFGYDTTKNQSN